MVTDWASRAVGVAGMTVARTAAVAMAAVAMNPGTVDARIDLIIWFLSWWKGAMPA